MSDPLVVETPVVMDILDQQGPALSSTNDIPIVETKPDSVAEQPKAEDKTKAEEPAEQPEESATSATEEDSGQPTAPRGVGKALAELRQQRREAEERAKAADERLSQALAALERATGKVETQVTDEGPAKPNKYDFPDPDAFEQALIEYADKRADWAAKREVKAAEDRTRREIETKTIEDQQKVAREAYQERIAKVTEKYPDFKEVAESPDVSVSIPMAHAIIHSPDGPELQYYLGKNPAEAKRISQLAPPLQLMELGFIRAQLNKPPDKPTISAAPKPIKPISAGTETVNKSLEELSMEEYAAKRKADWKSARH